VVQCGAVLSRVCKYTGHRTFELTAAHCSTLQPTAAHCNTLQYTATHCNKTAAQVPFGVWNDRGQHTMTHTATHCKTATSCQLVATYCNTLQRNTSDCNVLQHTATHVPFRVQNYRGQHVQRFPRCALFALPLPLCCSVLQCVAVCCSVLQCVAVC